MEPIIVDFGCNCEEKVECFIYGISRAIETYTRSTNQPLKSRIELIVENDETKSHFLLTNQFIRDYIKGFLDIDDKVSVSIELKGQDGYFLKKYVKNILEKLDEDVLEN